tara:strand:- start:24073 stop:24744 length:672 start_codon:yes stop_codon:yes gene_type:complete
MKKDKIIIITVITTILSLVIILMGYFGITRYISILLNNDTESYIKKYNKNQPLKDLKENIVICIYSNGKKLNKMMPTIHSLLDQTIQINNFFLISDIDNFNSNDKYLSRFTFLIPSKTNYGSPGNTIIPTLMKIKECNTIIIAVKNNIIYGKDFIEEFIKFGQKNKDSIIIDTKKTAWLIRPNLYGCNFLESTDINYNEDWFKKNTKDIKKFTYLENYKNIKY